MSQIYESQNFTVESSDKPFVSREDGGHLKIKVKDLSITDRTVLEPIQAIELMRLTMIVGEAFQIAMNNKGIPVVKINYQDMGNWAFKKDKKPYLHIHVFGRATNSVKQIFPESVYLPARESGFYDGFESLNDEDIEEIQKQIKIVESQERYNLKNWNLI
jgi:hypothetical protein